MNPRVAAGPRARRGGSAEALPERRSASGCRQRVQILRLTDRAPRGPPALAALDSGVGTSLRGHNEALAEATFAGLWAIWMGGLPMGRIQVR